MPKLAELNALDRAEFTRVIGPVFEHSPWVAARTEAQRPFHSREALHAALTATVRKASDEEKLCLIRAHPVRHLIGEIDRLAAEKGIVCSRQAGDLKPRESEKADRNHEDRDHCLDQSDSGLRALVHDQEQLLRVEPA